MKRFLWLTCSCILLAMPVAANTSRIYALNTVGDTVDVIDPVTNKVVQTIRDIPAPLDAVFSPDGSRAYIPSENSEHLLYVVDTKTGKTIKKVLLSGRPSVPAITKDGSKVYVAIEDPGPAKPVADAPLQEGHWDNKNIVSVNGGNMDIVDTTTFKVKTLVLRILGGGGLHDVSLSPDGKYMIAGCCEGTMLGSFLTAIGVKSEQPVWELAMENKVKPIAVEAGPDGSTGRLFVEITNLRGAVVVDFATHKEVGRIKLPEKPGGFPFIPESGKPSDSSAGNTHGSAITPDGKALWLASWDSNAVFVYSLPELKLQGYASLPTVRMAGHPESTSYPFWITFTADGKTGYVAMAGLKAVAAIDAETLKVVATIPVGEQRTQQVGTHVETLVLP